jgi:hypothetical protein
MAEASVFSRLVDILLPNGGVVMPLVEAYFDESESDGILCVAGYWYEKNAAIALDAQWKAILKKYHVEYFHMVECAHGSKQFKKINRQDRIEMQTALMNLIKRYASGGYAASFELEHAGLLPSAKQHGIDLLSPYAFCCYFALMGLRHWANENNFRGKIAYFFESGHANHAEANRIMNDIFIVDELKDFYRYGGHAFADKSKATALQTGDILAWQWRKLIVDEKKGRRPRKDLHSLLEGVQTNVHKFNYEAILDFRNTVARSNLATSSSEQRY